MKRTYQPNKRHRQKTHGFRSRAKRAKLGLSQVLQLRRRKGRKLLAK